MVKGAAEASAQRPTLNVQCGRKNFGVVFNSESYFAVDGQRIHTLIMRRCCVGLIALLCLAACHKQSGEAIVLEKEHIAAAPPVAESPIPDAEASPSYEVREMSPDEIAVDAYVMKRKDRGTSRDPRARKDEQWLVKVRTQQDGRTFNVPSDQAQFDRLKEGDRVFVKYSVGKYTGTVWGAEITEPKK